MSLRILLHLLRQTPAVCYAAMQTVQRGACDSVYASHSSLHTYTYSHKAHIMGTCARRSTRRGGSSSS